MSEKELILRIKAIADAAGFDKIKEAAGGMQDKMMGASKAVGAGLLVGGAAVAAFGVSAVSAAATFEAGMSNIQAVSGATTEEMTKVHAKAMQIGADTAFSAQEAAMGMEELLKAGVNTTEMLNGAADATIALASAGGTDLPTAAAIASSAMNNFGMSGAELPRVADLIAGAANASAISVEDFGYSLSASGAVANLAGVSFDDLSTAITAMGNAGIKGSDAGTSLKTFMSNMIPTTNTQIDAFKALGIITEESTGVMVNGLRKASDISKQVSMDIAGMSKAEKEAYLVTQFGNVAYDETGKKLRSVSELAKIAVRDHMAIATTQTEGTRQVNLFVDQQTGSFKSLAEVAGILKDKLGPLSETQRMVALEAMFGSDAIRAAAVIADNGAEGFTKLAQEMTKVTAADVAATRLDNLKGSVDAFWGSVETLQIKVGEKLLPTIRKIVDAGSGIVNAIGSLFGSATVDAEAMATGVAGSVNKTLLAGQGLSKAFAGLGIDIDPSVFTDLITAVQDSFGRIKEAFSGVEGGDLGGALVTVITKITDAIVFLVENPAVAKIALIFTGLVAAIAPVMMIVGPLIPIFTGLVSVIMGIIAPIGAAITAAGGLTAILGTVAAVLTGPVAIAIGIVIAAYALWQAKGDETKAAIGEFVAWIGAKWEELKAWSQAAWDAMGAAITLAWDTFKADISARLDAILSAVSTIWTNVKTAIADALEAIAENLRLKWDAFLRQISEKLDAILAKTTEAWTSVKKAIDDAMVAIAAMAQAALDNLRNAYDRAWAAIFGVIDTALEKIQTIVGDVLSWIEGVTGKNLDVIRNLWNAAMDAIQLAVAAVVNFLTGNWSEALSQAKEAARMAWDGIVAYFRDGWENVKKNLRIQELLDMFSDMKAKLMQIGGDIVDGLKHGIAGSWEALKRFLTAQIGDLIALAKRILGIASPSRVMAEEVGEPMAAGIIAGLDSGLRGRAIEPIIRLIGELGALPVRVTERVGATLAAGILTGVVQALGGTPGGAQGSGGLMGAIALALGSGMAGRPQQKGQTRSPFERTVPFPFGGGPMNIPNGGTRVGGVGDVVAKWNMSGRGGHVAASRSNYWQVFVQRHGVPTEASARRVAEKLGIPLPQWLEQIYAASGATPIDAKADWTNGQTGAGWGALPAAVTAATGGLASVGAAATALATALAAAVAVGGTALEPAIRELAVAISNQAQIIGGINLVPEPRLEPVLPIQPDPPRSEPMPFGTATVESVEMGDIVMGDTHVYLDGREIARAVARSFIDDVTILDDLGKALGQRAAQRGA